MVEMLYVKCNIYFSTDGTTAIWTTFPWKACVDVNVYTDRWEFVLLLIPCFLLQEEMHRKEVRLLRTMKGLNDLERKREDIFIEVLHDQVSYIFDDCTIHFTSQNRLSCSSTGEKPDYLHVHKNNTCVTCSMQLQFCHHNIPPDLANHSPQHCQC